MTSSNNSQNDNNYSLVAEAFIVAVVFTFIGWWISGHAGGPLLLDELTYMKVAILRTREVILINRYFPIYLLMPFIRLSGNPFLAVKVFWTILSMLTAVFVYLISRLLSKTIIPAVAAVILYFAQVWIFHYPGVIWPDFTLMLLISCIIWIYLLIPHHEKQQALLTGVIGALIYFAIRSKETSVVLVLLFIGYGYLDGEQFNWRVLTKLMLWSISGILAGIAFMFLLDFVVLGDAFWTVRGIIENMRLVMASYVERVDYNYLLLLSDGLDTFTLLILFIISGTFYFRRHTSYQRVIFLFPLVYMLMMTAALFHGPAVMEARYLVPVLPLMCVIATLMLRIDNNEPVRKKIIAVIAFIIGLIIIYLSAFWMIKLSSYFGIDKWDMNNFFMSILFPSALCAFIVIWFWAKNPNLVSSILSLLCFAVMIYHPLAYNYRFLATRWAARQSEYRFYPLREFEEGLSYSNGMRVFVSSNLPSGNQMNQESGMLGSREDVIATMYSVYFEQEAQADQFVIGTMDDYLKDTNQYSHAIITSEDWNNIPADRRVSFSKNYHIFRDSNDELVLIKQ